MGHLRIKLSCHCLVFSIILGLFGRKKLMDG